MAKIIIVGDRRTLRQKAFKAFNIPEQNAYIANTKERAAAEFFRAYQQELQRAQEELRVSHEEFRQGQAKPLDVDALIQRVQARVARHGSTP